MTTVTFGTDTYGRVKTVGKTPIVTKFAMLQLLPIYPLQSYYFTGFSDVKVSGIPFLAISSTFAINGIPLARVDRLSVAMAYIRGFFATMAVLGFIAIVPGIMYLTGEFLDEFAMLLLRGLIVSLLIGITGSLLSYLVPLTTLRERRIRTYCGEVFGICVDPAMVSADTATALEEYLARLAELEAIDANEKTRRDSISQLVTARSRIAQGANREELEKQTNDLLDRLSHLDRFSPGNESR